MDSDQAEEVRSDRPPAPGCGRGAGILFLGFAVLCGLFNVGPCGLCLGLAGGENYEGSEIRIPDPHRGGVYEVVSAGAVLNEWVRVYYQPVDGSSQLIAEVHGRSLDADDVTLVPNPNGLTIEVPGEPRSKVKTVLIDGNKLASLGGWGGYLMIHEGSVSGTRGPLNDRLIDVVLFLFLGLALVAQPNRRSDAPEQSPG